MVAVLWLRLDKQKIVSNNNFFLSTQSPAFDILLPSFAALSCGDVKASETQSLLWNQKLVFCRMIILLPKPFGKWLVLQAEPELTALKCGSHAELGFIESQNHRIN